MKTQDIQVSLDQLILDPNNYRLINEKEERHIPDSEAESLQEGTLKSLESQRLGVLKDSIRNHGFLEMERIVVRKLNTKSYVNKGHAKDTKYIVVEGNRRTAALKSLEMQTGKLKISEELKHKIGSLNVIYIEGEPKDIRTYSATLMGIRHVSGPKKWDGFQSAKLISDLYLEGHSLTEIGDILGITNREAGRRLRGFKAFTQMKNNSIYKEKVEPRHYGLLLEFLASSNNAREWLDWNDTNFEFENKVNLEIVYSSITYNQDDELEIRNPADARKFVALLDTHYKNEIEEGGSIHDMPDPLDLKDSGKLKRIKSFYSFVEKNSFKDEEMGKLSELIEVLEKILGER